MRTPPESFDTDRLRACRLRVDDAERVFEGWAQDPDVTRYLVWRPHRSLDESVEHATRCEEEWEAGTSFTWILEDPDTGRALGSIAAHVNGHRVALGYLLVPSVWGRGLMAEAVSYLTNWFLSEPEVHRVWAVCDAENPASARVLEKCGFELEGTLRSWMRHPNVSAGPRDALCYAIVRTADSSSPEAEAVAREAAPVSTYGLTHVALAVADPARSLRFYQAVFGVVAVFESDDFVQAQTPGTRDVLVFERRPGEAGSRGGIAHFGFRLRDPEEIDRALAAVRGAGGEILDHGEFVPGEPYVFFSDPDGYEVEIWYEIPTPVDPAGD